jgi:flavodoxin
MIKTLIICHSVHHDNTLKIARQISTVLDADLKAPEEIDPASCIEHYDLFGFGSGIYAGRHAHEICDCVKRFPDSTKPAFIFSTHALKRVLFYHTFLRQKLAKKGFFILPEFSCPAYANYGPLVFLGGMNKGKPDEADLSAARKFAHTLKAYFLFDTLEKK